ncbi:glycosyltransferase family 4 protein [Paenibacillus sp. GP183]|jgi:spore coat protein SA|uniref:glycosyltransferase family 4 protein n=1 Tax=Paenibacillus sp. GP183 TaxID=1882751 RepID=UPI00089B1696|nr:glycosyltransferase family 4 protein [Paenibacillus sp. GP183]SEC64067.1 spore coat protein SA [Paenibacillus sp. GP183]
MHICIVAPEQISVPPPVWGSVEICINEIAHRIAKHHKVTVISREHSRFKPITQSGNLTILRVASGSRQRYLNAVLQTLEGKQFDLIQVDNRPRYAAAIKRLFPDTPVSLFMHSLVFATPPEASVKSSAICLSKVDLIIANSDSLKSQIARLFPSQSHKVTTVLLGADLNRFRPPTPLERSSMKRKYKVEDGFNVLFVGRVIPKKGLPVLIRAVHQARRSLPDIRLIVAGGEQRKGYIASLKQQAKRLKVPALFLGKIHHHKLHSIYWLGDCFVCPSQKHEPFGLVNVEAMGSAVPVIASANGGIKEIIRDGENGMLVSTYHRAKEFAHKIESLAQNESLAKRLAMQARSDALLRFNWNVVANSLLKVYQQHQ